MQKSRAINNEYSKYIPLILFSRVYVCQLSILFAVNKKIVDGLKKNWHKVIPGDYLHAHKCICNENHRKRAFTKVKKNIAAK